LINKENIFCQVGSCGEIYKEIALNDYKPKHNLVATQSLFDTAIMLKCDPSISEEYSLICITKIKEILMYSNNNM
jgi:hypothetical protein